MNNVTTVKLIIFSLSLTLFLSQNATAAETNDFANVWTPFNPMDNEIFPAKIVAEAMLQESKDVDDLHLQGITVHTIGDNKGALGVAIGRDTDNVRVHLEVRLGNLAEVSTYDGILQKGGEGYAIFPKILWNYKVLEQQQLPTVINAEFSLSINGAVPEKKIQTYRVRSINDVPFAVVNGSGSIQKLPWMWGAFVNENHPWIDHLLREALNTRVVNEFSGYQGSKYDVINEVYAIWFALQLRGVTYSSITTPSGQSQSVFSQHVRFFEDSIRTSQANCVDGTVLFASVLRKIGIDPVLVWIPGHMFLGYWLDEEHTTINYLETTMIGNVNLRNFPRDGSLAAIGKTSQRQASFATYKQALLVGSSKVARFKQQFEQDDPNFEMIDIELVREMGIQPINH